MIKNEIIPDSVSDNSYTQVERLIIFRDVNQRFLLNLYNLIEKLEKFNAVRVEALKEKEVTRNVNTLIGVGFSLWRAAFLVADRKEGDILIKGKIILGKLIEDNAIAFPQEINNRKWVMGFYLNNAKFRLLQIGDKFQRMGIKVNVDFDSIEELSLSNLENMSVAWIRFHNAAVVIFETIVLITEEDL